MSRTYWLFLFFLLVPYSYHLIPGVSADNHDTGTLAGVPSGVMISGVNYLAELHGPSIAQPEDSVQEFTGELVQSNANSSWELDQEFEMMERIESDISSETGALLLSASPFDPFLRGGGVSARSLILPSPPVDIPDLDEASHGFSGKDGVVFLSLHRKVSTKRALNYHSIRNGYAGGYGMNDPYTFLSLRKAFVSLYCARTIQSDPFSHSPFVSHPFLRNGDHGDIFHNSLPGTEV